MKKNSQKIFKILSITIILAVIFTIMTACETKSKSDTGYWFNTYTTRLETYDTNANSGSGNLDTAGTYWNLTVKKDCDISISIITDGYSLFSSTYFYVNGTKIASETDTGIFTFAYKNLSLNKGDEIVIHSFWTNSLLTNNEGFDISYFCIEDETGTYIITDFFEE